MAKKILIQQDDQTLYKGKMVNMPVKMESIKEKSVELFDDEEPCIIHQSYCMKHFAETLSALFEQNGTDVIHLEDHEETLGFLDVDKTENTVIKLLGGKK